MASGDFVTPFILMAGLYGASSVLFWLWFRPLERATPAGHIVAGAPAPAD
jgi:hypothetical protein